MEKATEKPKSIEQQIMEMKIGDELLITDESKKMQCTLVHKVMGGHVYQYAVNKDYARSAPVFVPEPIRDEIQVVDIGRNGFDAHIRNLVRNNEELADDVTFERRVEVWRAIEISLGEKVFSLEEIKSAWDDGNRCGANGNEGAEFMNQWFKLTFDIDLTTEKTGE